MAAALRTTKSPPRTRAKKGDRDPGLPPGLGFTPTLKSPPAKAKTSPKREGMLPCLAYVVLYHAACIGALVAWHVRTHGVVCPTQALIAVFLVINAWICICELALLTYPTAIQREAAFFEAKYGFGVLPPVFLFQRATLREIFSLRYWAVMWSTYVALDPSYADTTTFGYCIDCGNGVTMLLPSITFAVGMTSPLLSPRVLGMLGLISFYQMAYGTVIYFFQYCFNRRFDRSTRAQVLGIVVPANGIWIAGPALGMWACSRLILDGTFDVFRAGYSLS